MPVREGRWVPWSTVIAAQKAAKAAEPEPEEEEVTEAPEPKAKRSRRSKAAAEAAIADATGVEVSLDEPVAVEDLPDIIDPEEV